MQNHFTIIIDSCNQEDWIEKCLNTCLTQKYDNYDVILVDAKSDDKTFEIAKKYVKDFKNFTIYQNEIRVPQIANMLWLTQLSKHGTICVSVDADDWLPHSKVLIKLNEVYNSGEVWNTYGSYSEFCGENLPLKSVSWHYNAYPDDVIKNNSFRDYKWMGSHLRTYRRELFLKIDENDFKLDDGRWLDTAGDQSFQLPICEMSSERSRYISDIMYIYNVANQSSDGNTNAPRQRELEKFVRSKSKYKRLEKLY